MVTFGVSVPLGVVGGIAPYIFEVVPDAINGAGGTISPQGIYTSSQKEGSDVIRVTDANNEIATFRISVGSPLKIFIDVIATYMGLESDQAYIANQKIKPIKDHRLYVSVAPLTSKVFGASNKPNDGAEEVSLNVFCPMDVTIMSKTTEALLRKEEVIMALNSTYSKQQQELNHVYFGQISESIVPISQEEGAAIPYAFNILANIQYVVKKSKAIDYFANFGRQITTNS